MKAVYDKGRENQRTRLTKRLIREAFLRLLQERDFTQITVQDICKEAQINRTTFYRYYDNQHQLLEIIENDLIQNLESHGEIFILVQDLETRDDALKILVDFYRSIQKNMDLYYTLVDRIHPNIFEKSRLLRTEETARAIKGDIESSQAQYMAEFIIAGGQRIASAWILKGDGRESPETMARITQEVLVSTIGASGHMTTGAQKDT